MQGRATVVLIGSSLGMFCLLALSCAGAATPATDDTLKGQIASAYGTPEAAGAGGAAGSGSTSTVLAPDTPGTGPTGAGGGAMAGGAGSTGMAGSAGMMGPCDGFAVLKLHCNGNDCHGSANTTNGLSNFAYSLDVAKSFVGKQSAHCGSQDLAEVMDPDNPGASLIISKVNGTSACGAQMPLYLPTLTVNDVNCLKDWIGSL